MDEPTLPTAAELGVTEAEYARILRDLRQRQGVPVEAAADPALPTGTPDPPTLAGRRGSGMLAVVAGLLAFVLVLLRSAGGEAAGEPAHAFLHLDGDQPVTYTSCRPIQVAVYPAGGPPDAEELVREAVSRVRSATGLDLVIIGAFGGHAPNWNFEAAPVHPEDPISVSWQDGAAIAEITDHTAGLGGSRRVATPGGGERYVAGTIALSRDYYAELAGRGDHDQALAVLLHEFGHVLGLAHVDAPGELMHHDNLGQTTFGPGDLEGLRRLGQGPCV